MATALTASALLAISMLIFGILTILFFLFIVALIVFLCTPKENIEKRSKRKRLMIISAVVYGVSIIAVITLVTIGILA